MRFTQFRVKRKRLTHRIFFGTVQRMDETPTFLPALKKAVDFFGSQDKAAAQTGIPQGTLSRWLSGKVRRIPYDAPIKFEEATGGEVKAREFYPS